MKKKSISELIHFFVRHPLQNSLQMKFWRWLVSPADVEATTAMFDMLLGDNLQGRKDYIAEFGSDYLEMADIS